MSLSDLTDSKNIVFVSTVPYFMVAQLGVQIHYLLDHGVKVTVITSPGKELKALQVHDHLRVVTIHISRKLEPLQDIKSLFKLYVFFKDHTFDLMHSTTPKAGLLCAIAAKLAGIPVRLHTFTGQAWVTRTGIMRCMMRWSDMLVIKLMNHCYADSQSQCDFMVKEGVAVDGEISVIGHGSLGGVDIKRFSSDRFAIVDRLKLRDELHMMSEDFVIIYIGRITGDKGVGELLSAFESFQQSQQRAHLLLLGPTDKDGISLYERALMQCHVHCLGYQSKPEDFLAISDVLCLPSYREGFGTVVIEAAAMGVPAIGTRISGLVDAIADTVTGILVPVRNVDVLQQAFDILAQDEELRNRMGNEARTRARDLFASNVLGEALLSTYIAWWSKT